MGNCRGRLDRTRIFMNSTRVGEKEREGEPDTAGECLDCLYFLSGGSKV